MRIWSKSHQDFLLIWPLMKLLLQHWPPRFRIVPLQSPDFDWHYNLLQELEPLFLCWLFAFSNKIPKSWIRLTLLMQQPPITRPQPQYVCISTRWTMILSLLSLSRAYKAFGDCFLFMIPRWLTTIIMECRVQWIKWKKPFLTLIEASVLVPAEMNDSGYAMMKGTLPAYACSLFFCTENRHDMCGNTMSCIQLLSSSRLSRKGKKLDEIGPTRHAPQHPFATLKFDELVVNCIGRRTEKKLD